MRDGAPLPGRTPSQVLSQLAYRVFGPLQPTRTRIVLDYHGLLDHPAGPLAQIAGRYRVTTRTVSSNVSAVRAAGTRLPLSASLIRAGNPRVRAGRRPPEPGANRRQPWLPAPAAGRRPNAGGGCGSGRAPDGRPSRGPTHGPAHRP